MIRVKPVEIQITMNSAAAGFERLRKQIIQWKSVKFATGVSRKGELKYTKQSLAARRH